MTRFRSKTGIACASGRARPSRRGGSGSSPGDASNSRRDAAAGRRTCPCASPSSWPWSRRRPARRPDGAPRPPGAVRASRLPRVPPKRRVEPRVRRRQPVVAARRRTVRRPRRFGGRRLTAPSAKIAAKTMLRPRISSCRCCPPAHPRCRAAPAPGARNDRSGSYAEIRATSSIEVTPSRTLREPVLAQAEHPLLPRHRGDLRLRCPAHRQAP